MKSTTYTTLFVLILLLIGTQPLQAQKQSSWKGKDVRDFRATCLNEIVPNMKESIKSENLSLDGPGFCECLIVNLQKHFPTMEHMSHVPEDDGTVEEVAVHCAKQYMHAKRPDVDIENRHAWTREDLRNL